MHASQWLVATAAAAGGSVLTGAVAAYSDRASRVPSTPSAPPPLVRCHEASPQGFAVLDKMWATIQERKAAADTQKSWTARLLMKGPEKCAQKVGEEATEVVIEAASRRHDGLVKESADLLYHLFVLWASLGVEPREVLAELSRRDGVSGVSEKASRPK
mmetsp:Transcript_99596/g.257538  ORF Transcript_99596/g.257538 Transcript_99596/m.257538 type:complete len:159 (-) Transcript_99596:230-706(-)